MSNKFKNEKGITLVELLAVLAIGGIVMVLIMNIFSNGQNQYSSQTAKAEQLNDVRYAAKVITKEIRKSDKVEIVNSSTLKLGKSSHVIFTLNNKNEILKNGTILVSGIEKFNANWDKEKEGELLKISIEGEELKGRNQNIDTEIFIRGGDIDE